MNKRSIIETNKIGQNTKIEHFTHIKDRTEIGANCNIGDNVFIDTDVKIGNNVKIESFSIIYKGVEIEDGVCIGPAVIFTNELYPRNWKDEDEKIIPTIVRKGSSIGAHTIVVCGLTIGEYANIEPGSLVTNSVPPFGLISGNPAKLKGYVCICGETKKKNTYKCEKCGRLF